MSATPSGNPPGELEQMEMVGIETAEPVKNDKMRKTTTWVVIGVVAVAVVAVSGWLFNEHQQRELNSLRRQLHSLEAEVDDFKKALTLVSGMQTPDELTHLIQQASESAIADVSQKVDALASDATDLRSDFQEAKEYINHRDGDLVVFEKKVTDDLAALKRQVPELSALSDEVTALVSNATRREETSVQLHADLQEAKTRISDVEKALTAGLGDANTERELTAFKEEVTVDLAALTDQVSESASLIADITEEVNILSLNATQGEEANINLRADLQDAKTHIGNVEKALTAGLENANTERGDLVETFNTKLTAFKEGMKEEVKEELTSELQPLPYVCLVDGGVNEGNAWKLDSTDSIWVPAGDPYPHHLPKKGLLEFRLRVTEAAPRTGRILNVGRFDVHISPVGILVDRLADGSLFVEVRSVNQYANVTVSTSGAEQFVQIAFTEQSFTLYIDGVVVAAPAAGFTSQASLSYSQDPAAPNTFVGYVCYLENKFKDAFWERMMNRVIESGGYESDTTRKVSVMQLTDGTAITSKWKQLVAGDTVGSGNSGASIVDDWELFVHLSDFGNVGSAWMGDQSVSVDTNLFKVGGGLLSSTVSSLSTQISSLESETTSHSTQISSLESETTSHSTQISSLESQTSSQSSQLSALVMQTSSQSSQITSIIGDLRSGCELHYLGWTEAVNNYDSPFHYECPHNYFVIGVGGWHDNGKEDRQFVFKCATVKCSNL